MKFWLLKSEPNVWSIDHQKKAGLKGVAWDGVRNYQAGDGPEAVLDEGAEEGCRRMDVSHAGMERKAYERVENGGVRAFCRHFKAFHGVL